MTLPDDFRDLLIRERGREAAERILAGYGSPAPVSVRINPDKVQLPSDSCLKEAGARKVAHSRYGFFLDRRPVFTFDPSFQAGCYYVQEASSMFLEAVLSSFEFSAAPRVLDLCAAPGGKSTHLLSLLRRIPGALLVSNEVMKNRATVLCENLSKWGTAASVVTGSDPSAFGRLAGYFDLMVVDAPCSGEGMFRKDPVAVAEWSLENVAFCASRQRRILTDVWPALKEGGMLLYSTCTLNRSEDEEMAQWIRDGLGAELLGMKHFSPGLSWEDPEASAAAGEGFFIAWLRKTSSVPEPVSHKSVRPDGRSGMRFEEWKFSRPVRLERKGDLLKAYPEELYEQMHFLEQHLKVLRSGVAVAEVKEGKRSSGRTGGNGCLFLPELDFVLSELYIRGTFPEVEVDRETALRYMRKENIQLPDAPAGFIVLIYRGQPFALAKNIVGRPGAPGRINNLWPASRRILSRE